MKKLILQINICANAAIQETLSLFASKTKQSTSCLQIYAKLNLEQFY
jgi:hypothetical protein